MINKTVRGMVVLAAAGLVWTAAASTGASATTTADTTADTTAVAAANASTEGSSPHREGADRGHGCFTTTAWGSGCPGGQRH
ncbi:hypothetical protein ACIRBY_37780 [Streptomyces sp. NPDC096136]|uniref:hypothetical protein n=1 Tax=Streptomyces sp. NPDC096136 TaxID=3366076 RepID=UPI003826B4CC